MRTSEFRRLMEEEFGPARAGLMVDTLHLPGFDDTASDALASGADPRDVWREMCDLNGVPESRRLGRDIPPKR